MKKKINLNDSLNKNLHGPTLDLESLLYDHGIVETKPERKVEEIDYDEPDEVEDIITPMLSKYKEVKVNNVDIHNSFINKKKVNFSSETAIVSSDSYDSNLIYLENTRDQVIEVVHDLNCDIEELDVVVSITIKNDKGEPINENIVLQPILQNGYGINVEYTNTDICTIYTGEKGIFYNLKNRTIFEDFNNNENYCFIRIKVNKKETQIAGGFAASSAAVPTTRIIQESGIDVSVIVTAQVLKSTFTASNVVVDGVADDEYIQLIVVDNDGNIVTKG